MDVNPSLAPGGKSNVYSQLTALLSLFWEHLPAPDASTVLGRRAIFDFSPANDSVRS